MQAISASLGSTPTQLSLEYMAPSAWASIGNLATKLDKLGEAIGRQVSRFESHKKTMGEWCESKINSNFSQHHKRMEEFKATFIGTVRALSKRIDNVELSLEEKVDSTELASGNLVYTGPAGTRGRREADALSRLGPEAIETMQQADEMAQGISAQIESRMISMETKLSALMAKGDERAINFAGLGFLSIGDSNAWLDSFLKSHPSGLIVDVHMVFEHIHYALEGIDTISTMEKLYKIKVTCIADSVAMTSFDTKTPKFFSKVQGHRVLKGDASYLDLVPCHADWSDVGTGFRMRLQEALAEFQESHASFIDQSVEIGSKPHTLAHAALTESAAWIIGFIQFIDEYYRELSKAKFGSAKAWHVTTRLAKRILDDVGTQRYGVQNAFHVGDSRQICQQIVWAVLKSHDTMTQYKRLNFKNHPSISTELVKFLAINTSFESIEKLTSKVCILEAEAATTKKLLAISEKASSSAGNKADEVRKLCDALIKRVAKLEN
jgi:hypothetical protein